MKQILLLGVLALFLSLLSTARAAAPTLHDPAELYVTRCLAAEHVLLNITGGEHYSPNEVGLAYRTEGACLSQVQSFSTGYVLTLGWYADVWASRQKRSPDYEFKRLFNTCDAARMTEYTALQEMKQVIAEHPEFASKPAMGVLMTAIVYHNSCRK